MSGEFLDEPQAEDWSLRGMMQDMKTDQASVEVLVSSILTFSLCMILHFVIEIRYIGPQAFCQLYLPCALAD